MLRSVATPGFPSGRLAAVAALVLGACAGEAAPAAGGSGPPASGPADAPSDLTAPGYTFVAAEPAGTVPDPTTNRLCPGWDDPESLTDTTYIDCPLEVFDFTGGASVPATDRITVMAFNLERGLELDAQLAWIAGPDAPDPDVILISEADRGCSRSGGANVMAEWGKALGMHSVFAVEFVELPRGGGDEASIDETCEHGNGILSRYPIGNVAQIRHRTNKSWYLPPDERDGGEPRLGGRIAVAADIKAGDQIVHAISLHFESDPARAEINEDQALELVEFAADKPHQTVIGGDTNAPFYFLDLRNGGDSDITTQAFLTHGYVDAHAGLPPGERSTSNTLDVVIDLIFGDGDFFAAPAICEASACSGLSDHLPVWVDVHLR